MEKGDETTRPSVDLHENGPMRGQSDTDECDSTEKHYGCAHYKRRSKFVVSVEQKNEV